MILGGIIMLLMAAASLFILGGALVAKGTPRSRLIAAIVPAALLLAVVLYAIEGEFGRGDAPLSKRSDTIAAARKDAEAQRDIYRNALVEAQARLAEDPDDIKTLFALVEAAARTDNYELELTTLNHLLSLTGNSALHGMIAQALTRQAGGIVTLKALDAIERGLESNPDDWQARYLMGLYLSQNGDDRGALDLWVPLAEDFFGSPVYPIIVAAIEQSAARLGTDASTLLPQTEARMTEEDIRNMVAGLEDRLMAYDSHESRDSWLMLVRSLMILEADDRRDLALNYYLSLDLDDAEDSAAIIAMAEIMLPPDNMPEAIPPVMIALIEKARELTPDESSVLFFSGLVARQQGDRAGVLEAWGILRGMIDDENPLAPILDAEIKAAGG